MSQPHEIDAEFVRMLEQAYWDRRLAILKLRSGIKLSELRAQQVPQLEGELLLLEGFRSWLRQGRPFNSDSAKRMVVNMKKVEAA